MSKLLGSRKLLLGGIVAVVVAGSAFAYWTMGGSGTGSAPVAGASAALTANQTTVLTAMFPGDRAQTISGTFDNTNPGPIYVTSVTVSITSVVLAAGTTGTCDATDFVLAGATMAVGHEVAVGAGLDEFTGATIKFNNKAAANQNACKSATVNLGYAIA